MPADGPALNISVTVSAFEVIYENLRLFLLLWFLCSAAGITAGAALAFLLFHYREPRQREEEGRRQTTLYAAIAGLTIGVVIALFLVPARADARVLWLLFAVWIGALSAVIAGIYVFKVRLLCIVHTLPPREAARTAAVLILNDLRVPKSWLTALGPAADYADGHMERLEELAVKTGRRLARTSTPRPRNPARDALPPEREPLPAEPPREPEPEVKPPEEAPAPGKRRLRRIRPR